MKDAAQAAYPRLISPKIRAIWCDPPTAMEESEARFKLCHLFPEIVLSGLLRGASGGRFVFRGCYMGRQIIAKLHPDPKKASQESNALEQAKRLLGQAGLGVPAVIDTKHHGIVVEFIAGSVPDVAGNDRHLRICIEYLAGMAQIDLPTGIPNHYFAAHLKHRLNQERNHFEAAKSEYPGVADFQADFERIFGIAMASVDSDPTGVAGHGDFQPKNLVLTASEELVPIDWMDFGIAHQGYDLGNLLFELDEIRMRKVFAWDSDLSGRESSADRLRQCLAITCIIRAGANLRQLKTASTANRDSLEDFYKTLRIYKKNTLSG